VMLFGTLIGLRLQAVDPCAIRLPVEFDTLNNIPGAKILRVDGVRNLPAPTNQRITPVSYVRGKEHLAVQC
jgi:hypothetical protein